MRLGFYLAFADKPDVVASARALNAVKAMRQNLLIGVTEIIPSYLNVYFEFETRVTTKKAVQVWADSYLCKETATSVSRPVEIPVQYNGIDLEFISEKTSLTVSEIIRLHSSQTYHAFAVGFTPGFPFLGLLPEALRLPRRSTPRAKVEAHSVAMALGQTGVYPFSSPGGWHLLGSAGVAMFDPHRKQAFWVEAGDSVRFVPTQSVQIPKFEPLRLLPLEPRFPVLKLEQAGLQTMLLDAGRTNAGHFGLAQSGVLDWRSAALANAVVGNGSGTPLLELTLTGGVFTALADVVLGFAGYGMNPILNGEAIVAASSFLLRRGQTLRFASSQTGVRAYLSIAGGFEAQSVWGSVSADIKAGLGRALQTGEVLGAAAPRATRAGFYLSQATLEPLALRLLEGAQPNPEAMAMLCEQPFVLERADRMGARLSGATVAGGEVSSEATPLGAVQITPSGQLIILLNDRGRMGGYAKPALLHPNDLWRLAQVRDGQMVRFSRFLNSV